MPLTKHRFLPVLLTVLAGLTAASARAAAPQPVPGIFTPPGVATQPVVATLTDSTATAVAQRSTMTVVSSTAAEAEVLRVLPANVTVLTRDDFANRQWFSVADVLDQAVSINVGRTGARGDDASASIRGLSGPDALVIAIDGRPITHAFGGTVDLSQIPLNIVDRIEITRGGANVKYGPAAAGIVNIITSRPDRKGLIVDLGTGIGRHGVKDSNGRFLLRNWAGDALYIGGIEDSGGYTQNQGSDFTSHFGNFTRSFAKGGYVGADYLYTKGNEGKPEGTLVPFDQWNGHAEHNVVSQDMTESREYQTLRVNAASPKVADGTFHLDLADSQRDMSGFDSTGQIFSETNRAADVRLNYERSGLDAGGEYAHNLRNNDGLPKQSAENGALYLTNRFQSGAWVFQPGLRWDHHDEGGQAPTYRAALLYQPANGWTASLTGQRAPRFPTMNEFFNAAGESNNLTPERTDSIDGGLVWQTGRIRVASTYFSAAARDVIAPGPSGDLTNGANERSSGVETEASARIGRGNWSELNLRGGWTHQDARRRDIGGVSFGKAPLTPDDAGWISAALRLPWKATLTNDVRYKAAQWTGTGETGVKIPPFAVWSARYSVKIHSADLYFACENLLRRPYAEAVSAAGALEPRPAQTFWAGVNIRFMD